MSVTCFSRRTWHSRPITCSKLKLISVAITLATAVQAMLLGQAVWVVSPALLLAPLLALSLIVLHPMALMVMHFFAGCPAVGRSTADRTAADLPIHYWLACCRLPSNCWPCHRSFRCWQSCLRTAPSVCTTDGYLAAGHSANDCPIACRSATGGVTGHLAVIPSPVVLIIPPPVVPLVIAPPSIILPSVDPRPAVLLSTMSLVVGCPAVVLSLNVLPSVSLPLVTPPPCGVETGDVRSVPPLCLAVARRSGGVPCRHRGTTSRRGVAAAASPPAQSCPLRPQRLRLPPQ